MIDSFSDEYAWLSNFYPAYVEYEGEEYRSVEHAYQAAKTLDLVMRAKIKECQSPGQAKRMGQKVVMLEDWGAVRVSVMEYLLRQKFKPDTVLAQQLLNTGNAALIEGNVWYDVFWGVCNGVGQNHLGKLLMKIRQDLRFRASLSDITMEF